VHVLQRDISVLSFDLLPGNFGLARSAVLTRQLLDASLVDNVLRLGILSKHLSIFRAKGGPAWKINAYFVLVPSLSNSGNFKQQELPSSRLWLEDCSKCHFQGLSKLFVDTSNLGQRITAFSFRLPSSKPAGSIVMQPLSSSSVI
jgi:hypothetical protein